MRNNRPIEIDSKKYNESFVWEAKRVWDLKIIKSKKF